MRLWLLRSELSQLILRDEELTDIDQSCAQQLVSLEILSLSHNRLSSLDQFQYFAQLIEVRESRGSRL